MEKKISIQILLGICGGIAAYKSAELTRLFIKQGHDVRVVMTDSAKQFISPLTFQALTGHPVSSNLLDESEENAMGHINLAKWADLMIIAPATANSIAKMSYGIADNLLSTLFLAIRCPVYIAPAMNQAMWLHPSTQNNIQLLKQQGVSILEPNSGSQACGDIGPGRMMEPLEIIQAILNPLTNDSLNNKHVLITAGPTREPIDPVRYITNRSSGKMGYALAEAALQQGARVTLISGPVFISASQPIETIYVETANQMYQSVMNYVDDCDIFISAAAVADYTPAKPESGKIKKGSTGTILNLTKTIDILATTGSLPANKRPSFIVGFAAETDNLEQYALKKLTEKNADMIAANWVGQEQGGFDKDENALQVYWKGGKKMLGMKNKKQLANQLMSLIIERMNEKSTIKNSG